MKQITITTNGKDFVFSEVHKSASMFTIQEDNILMFIADKEANEITLPPGQYGTPKLCSLLTEEEWKEVIPERDWTWANDYESATQYGYSLLASHGFSPDKTVLIEKIK